MKKTITILTSLLCLNVLTAQGDEEESRFRKGEFDILPYCTYVYKTGGKWGAGAAVTYFLTKSIGVGASTFWTDFSGQFFDNVEAEGYFRLPVFKRLAPYAVGGVGHQFQANETFGTLGAGIDFRAFKRFEAFSDIQYRFVTETRNGIFLRIGLRFA